METKEFHRAMKEHCQSVQAECQNCCMRLYCYTPPCEQTDGMIDNIISFLSIEQNHTEADSHSDRHSVADRMPCPCSMDMSSALGYEPR